MRWISSRLNSKYFKSQFISSINHARWRTFLLRKKIGKAIIVIVVPGLEHICIPCVRLLSPFFTIILVDNGLSKQASQWLSFALPHSPIFKLQTSFKGRGRYTFPHGNALELLTCVPYDLIFLDPDCYIFEPSLIVDLFHRLETHAIASLYADHRMPGFSMPDTYCFGINAKSVSYLRSFFDIRFGVTSDLSSPLLDCAIQVWGNPVPFPHPGKNYFDTVHSVAISAYLTGMGVSITPSSKGEAYHVLGTSYRLDELQDSFSDINTTALNAHYFHCLVAEYISMPLPNSNVNKLISYYGGSIGILDKFPGFTQSQQRFTTDELFTAMLQRKVLFWDSETFCEHLT